MLISAATWEIGLVLHRSTNQLGGLRRVRGVLCGECSFLVLPCFRGCGPLQGCRDGVPVVDVHDRVRALLQRLAAVRGRLSLCADQAAAAKWWLSMPMASVSAEGPMPKALSTRRTSPLMPGCRHQGRACPLRRARMTSNPLIVA